MADPIVHITAGIPDSGTGNITTLGQTLTDGANATMGTTTGAAVVTDASGTLQQYLRGLVKLFAAAITATGRLFVQISDGTNSPAIKAASTAPIATDPALVVSLSPNSSGIVSTGSALSPPGGSTVLSTQGVADLFGVHKEVAASQTAAVLGATGAIGDYLAYVTVFPGTAGCGVVTILDNTTSIGSFAGGGTTALPSLVPFTIQVGAYCTGAGWHITTGANVTVSAVGKFT